MKIGTHNTAKCVWEKFKTQDECAFEYCADGDGFVVVHEVLVDCLVVTNREAFLGLATSERNAIALIEGSDANPQNCATAAIKAGECLLVAEAAVLSRFPHLDGALTAAENYANATYPGMLEKFKRWDRQQERA